MFCSIDAENKIAAPGLFRLVTVSQVLNFAEFVWPKELGKSEELLGLGQQ